MDIINEINDRIKRFPKDFPFISAKWEISLINTTDIKVAKFHKHMTKSHQVRSFYKPVSKIFDFSKIEKNG